MIRILIINILLAIIPISGFGQKLITFYVKGTAQLNTRNSEKTLAKGDIISNDHSISLNEGAVVAIIDENGHHISISEKGKYSFFRLIQIIEKTGSDISAEYFAYVWKKLNTKKVKDPDEMSMNISGGVSRAENALMQMPCHMEVIQKGIIAFQWEDTPEEKYLFIFDENNNSVLKIKTSDSHLTLYPFDSGLKEGKYYWVVSKNSNAENQPKYEFIIPDKDWKSRYEKERNDFLKEISFIENPEAKKELLQEFEASKGIYD